MSGQLLLSYPYWFLLLCVVLGVGISVILYFKDKLLEEKPVLKFSLAFIRAFVIAALAFLLLGPVWKGFITKTDKPIVIYLEDTSNSIELYNSASDLATFQNKKQGLLNQLDKQFQVEKYQFGANHLSLSDSLAGNEKATNISEAIEKTLEQHSNQNVGAIILATDGIYNQGYNPIYSKVNKATSIYTIALGDSAVSKDIFIQSTQYPKIVYLGDQFQLDVDFGAYNLEGKSASLRVLDENKTVLLDKTINISSDELFDRASVVINANSAGVQKYSIQISTNAEEDITTNNYQSVYVEILDGRKNVLLLYDGPHPDVKALKSVIESNKNYEVTVSAVNQLEVAIDNFDLVFLHGLPSKQGNGKSVFNSAKDKGKSIGLIVTPSTDLLYLNNQQKVLKIALSGQPSNEVQAAINKDFNEFEIPNNWLQSIRNFPPLIAPFGDYELGVSAKTIAFQRLGDIQLDNPLIIAGQEENTNYLFITGEGLWRWRMTEFAQTENTAVFDGFFNQIIQYVTVKEDKRKFRLFTSKNLIWENESINFNAELYNANYALINEPDVNLEIQDSEGKTYDFVFDKTVNAYRLETGLLPIGNYTAIAKTQWANENYSAAVKFTVREVQLETMNKQANFGMLYNLSESSGGEMVMLNNISSLENLISENVNLKPVLYDTVKTTSLLYYKWIFFILLGLLAIEWITRKYMGGY